MKRSRAVSAAVAAIGLAVPSAARATTITVDSGADGLGSPTACTLRAAIIAANTNTAQGACPAGSATDTVVLTVPTVTLALVGANEDAAQTGDLDITSVTSVLGRPGGTTIDGAHLDRVFDVRAGGDSTFRDLMITGGRTPAGANASVPPSGTSPDARGNGGAQGGDGGGIASAGPLTLDHVTVTGNATGKGGNGGSAGGASANQKGVGGGAGHGGHGGGVFVEFTGSLTVLDSVIRDNVTGAGGAGGSGTGAAGAEGDGGSGASGGFGGGIYGNGALVVRRSTISGNRTGDGGAGGQGNGGAGSAAGQNGGPGKGGSGSVPGFGGGIYTLFVPLTVETSLVTGNTLGNAGAGGSAIAGSGAINNGGRGGGGGDAAGGSGGFGGVGGGIEVARESSSLDPPHINATTVSDNTTGTGADGGDAHGGSGNKGSTFGGAGGDAKGGSGGSAGVGGGIDGGDAATVFGLTVVGNVAAGATGTPGTPSAGQGGLGAAVDGSQDGATGTITAGTPGGGPAGGGIGSSFTARGSIISGNLPTNCIFGADATDVANPVGGCTGALVADPLLTPLGDHGGPTRTFALLAGSPATDLVPTGPACTATDQRGVPRPRGAKCDAGAYERAAPRAVTGGASAITKTAATLAGTVDPFFLPGTWHVQYGRTTAYGSSTPDRTAGSGNADAPVAAAIAGLTEGTTYHYRLVAANGEGTGTGADRTFKTATTVVPPPPPPPKAAPRLSGLTITATKHGRRITYRDTQAATTTFAVDRALRGVRKGTRCVAPPKHPRKGAKPRRCTRFVPKRGTFSHRDKAGKNTVAWSLRLRGHKLTKGTYRLRARPALGRLKGKVVTRGFRVRR